MLWNSLLLDIQKFDNRFNKVKDSKNCVVVSSYIFNFKHYSGLVKVNVRAMYLFPYRPQY